jgi:hypothetical protein
MICFRDQSFCKESDQCATSSCDRKWTTEQQAAAQRWWGGPNAPVSFMPLKDKCARFKEKK